MPKKDISAVLIKKPRKTRTAKKEMPEFIVEPILNTVSEEQESISEVLISSLPVKNRAFNNVKSSVFKVLVSKFNLFKRTVTERPVLTWLVAMIVGLSVFYWYGVQTTIEDSAKESREETIKLLAEISKIIVLPDNEIPVIATVNDPVKLSDQPFFIKAKVGDKVLIYPNNKKAILYSPENNKIIEVAPLNID